MIQRSTVGSLLRSMQAFCGQLCEKETLEYGIVYCCPRFPTLPEVNQFREVVIDDAACIPAAFQQAEQAFGARQVSCRRWATAGGTPTPELHRFLSEQGFVPHSQTAMTLTRWPDPSVSPSVRIIPARAVREAYRKTFLVESDSASPQERAERADSFGERLDDPSFDAIVAMVDGVPAGRCVLFQVGDIARVIDLCVGPGFDGKGVETALLSHALTLAKRLAMRNICTLVESEDAASLTRLHASGFVEDGVIVEFERDRL